MEKGGETIAEEGPDAWTGLTLCNIRSVHQEEMQLLKKDQKMNSILHASGVKLNPRLVNTRKLNKKDRTQSYVRSQCIGRVRSPFGHFWTSLYSTELWFTASGHFHRHIRSIQLVWIRSISSVTIEGALIYIIVPAPVAPPPRPCRPAQADV